MGRLDIAKHLFPEQSPDDDAVEVGLLDKIRDVELTRIIADDEVDGGFRYDGQVWVELSDVVMRSLDYDVPGLCFQRMEFRVSVDNLDITPGSILCCSETPYSSFWAASTPFLKGSKAPLPAFQDRETMLQEVEKARLNWWDRDRKFLTASLPEAKFQYFLYARRKFLNYGSMWVFAVVINHTNDPILDMSQVETQLFSSNTVQRFIKNAETGNLRVGKSGATPRSLSREEANALAFLSIRQALAGPAKDIEQRENLPVVDEFARIFTDQLHVLSERIESRENERRVAFESEDYEKSEAHFLGSSASLADPEVILLVQDEMDTAEKKEKWKLFEQDSLELGEGWRNELFE